MSEAAGTNPPAEAVKPAHKIYSVGTLRYTTFGLVMLCVWLLWGDFICSLLDGSIPGILPLKLKDMGAGDTTIVFLNRTIAYAIVFMFAPMVSFKSDRYRSRWGRRIPFLAWSTPFVGLFMVLIGCYDGVTHFFIGNAQQISLFGFEIGRATMYLIVIGILFVGFDFSNIFVGTIYWYLFNDVVPAQFLSRFLSLFRMVGIVAGMLYNWLIFPISLDHFRFVFVAGGIAYVVGFLVMCFLVKEGQYPPPPENIDKKRGLLSSIKTFAKECFTHRFYWYFFLMNVFFWLSWQTGIFGMLRNRDSLGLTLAQMGWMGVVIAPVSFLVQYPCGWLADKYNPIRVYVVASLISVLSNFVQCIWLFQDFNPWGNLMMLYAISFLFLPVGAVKDAAEIPMYMRLLPKERYGQFCSANAMLRSFAMIFGSLLAGVFMQYFLGSLPARDYVCVNSGITSSAEWKPSWTEEKVGPWQANYVNQQNASWTFKVPGASAVKLYFTSVNPAKGDNVTTDAVPPNNWAAPAKGVYSNAKPGDTITVTLADNAPATGNFTVAKVAYQGKRTGAIEAPLAPDRPVFPLSGRVVSSLDKKGVAGVSLSFSRVSGKSPLKTPSYVTTDADGNWKQTGFSNGCVYSITAERTETEGGTWTFDPQEKEVVGATAGLDITAKPPFNELTVGPWPVNYMDNASLTGTIKVPGATWVKAYFAVVSTESAHDNITTDGAPANLWNGEKRGVWSNPKPSDTLTVRLVSDVPARGNFMITKVAWVGRKTGEIKRDGDLWKTPSKFPLSGRVVNSSDGAGVAGVTVSFREKDWFWNIWDRTLGGIPKSVTTDANGNWTQTGFAGRTVYTVSTSKAKDGGTWLFSPARFDVSGATRGIATAAIWTTPSEWKEEKVGPWMVNFAGKTERSGTITVPGATAVIVYFDSIEAQPGVDHVTTDAGTTDDWSDAYSGVFSNVKAGDNITVKVTGGEGGKGSIVVKKVMYKGTRTGPIAQSGDLWGFILSGTVTSKSDGDIGLAGVDVSFKLTEGKGAVPPSVKTDAKGNWTQCGFVAGCHYAVVLSKPESDGTWTFSPTTLGDWRYRYYPVWTIFFQIFGILFLLLLYREWKKLGGAQSYTPPAA